MRSKQLLGVVFLLLMASVGAEAAAPQLTGIGISGGGNTTTVTLRASGAFTHTEYRPSENLLLLDLVGVDPGKLSGSTQAVNRPGLLSYHVSGYSGAHGSPVARIELTLNPAAVVTLAEAQGGLQVQIEGGGRASAAPAAPALMMAAQRSEVPARSAGRQLAPEKPVTVRKVSVLRGRAGMEVEILADGQVKPSTMKLAHPDRVVVDLPNSRLAGTAHAVTVNNSEIKEVRIALRQQNPPLTRVVLDLKAPLDYDVVPAGNKIVVKLHGGQPGAAAEGGARPSDSAPSSGGSTSAEVAAAPTAPSAALAETAASQPAAEPAGGSNQPASDFVFVDASYKPAAAPAPSMPRAADAKAAADKAAHVLAGSGPTQLPSLASPVSGALGTPAGNMAAEQQQAAQAPGTTAPRYTGEPISVNLKDVDLKDFFRLIHEISGLNIVLDPNVHGTLTLVLDDVPWDQALDIVLQNNQLERRLEGNVLRIATMDTFRREADARRAADEAQALAVPRIQVTHFLSYAHAQEVMPIVKRFLTPRGDVVADIRTNSLLIQDIPSVMPQIQTVLAQLDRKTQEVEIEARVVAATRNFAREIGTQLGFGWGNSPTAIGGAQSVGTSPLTPGYVFPPPYFTIPAVPPPNLTNIQPGTPLPVTNAAIPLFSNLPAVGPTSGISLSNIGSSYRIDSILTLAESRGLLKILSRPRVVTQNNIGATVKQGTRIPVVTLAQLGGPPTTTYVDAELRLQVTPQITAENTIFMNIDVENTTPDFSHQVQGNPSLVTQQATTSVLVTDGGTAVIGGVIQTQNSIAIQQVPLLGNLPVFGNLFKHRAVSTQTQELIFFITPKIVQT